MASSLGFHDVFYIPKLKKTYFKNIRVIDNVMKKHLNLLKKHNISFIQSRIK
jgi:hypothetical protein